MREIEEQIRFLEQFEFEATQVSWRVSPHIPCRFIECLLRLQATEEDHEIQRLREEIKALERELLEAIRIERERRQQMILEQQLAKEPTEEIQEEEDDDEEMRRLKEEILKMVRPERIPR